MIPTKVVKTKAVLNGFIITMMPSIRTNIDITIENSHVSSANFLSCRAKANLNEADIINHKPMPIDKIPVNDNGLIIINIPAIILKIP